MRPAHATRAPRNQSTTTTLKLLSPTCWASPKRWAAFDGGSRTRPADAGPGTPAAAVPLADGGTFRHWFEALSGTATVHHRTADGRPAIMGGEHLRYLAGWPSDETFVDILRTTCAEVGVATQDMPGGLRLRETPEATFAFNYGADPVDWQGQTIPAAGVAWVKR